jgi:hypothetical protein
MENFLMLLQAVPIINTLLQTVNNEVMETADLNYFEEYSDVHTHTHMHAQQQQQQQQQQHNTHIGHKLQYIQIKEQTKLYETDVFATVNVLVAVFFMLTPVVW